MPAGYSGTPLPQKLGIKPGHQVLLVNAPADFESELVPFPEDVRLLTADQTDMDVILAFFSSAAELQAGFATLAGSLKQNGGLWVCWPKKASGVKSDLSDNVVRAIGLEAGLVDNKGCAVTEIWSGLRFVYRLRDRK
ncbi:MAG: DUF3052 family protein [Chloroflexi bacterium]|nr:DUF3052 family protein [Chloroflexota bacterium]